jgi:hypothetical protein
MHRNVTKREFRKCFYGLFGIEPHYMMVHSSRLREVVMLLSFIRRLTACFTTPLTDQSDKYTVRGRSAAAPAALPFDPVWHGDHWQNLLSSPMDARHYVMEDWSIAPGAESSAATVTRRA